LLGFASCWAWPQSWQELALAGKPEHMLMVGYLTTVLCSSLSQCLLHCSGSLTCLRLTDLQQSSWNPILFAKPLCLAPWHAQPGNTLEPSRSNAVLACDVMICKLSQDGSPMLSIMWFHLVECPWPAQLPTSLSTQVSSLYISSLCPLFFITGTIVNGAWW
jgi:hypothetical protein